MAKAGFIDPLTLGALLAIALLGSGAHAVEAGTTGTIGNVYPPESLAAGEQGVAGFELDVDAAGKVAACRITRSSGFARLDAATCALMMQQAHFRAKLDRHGQPIAGHYRNRINWKLPPPGE